MEATIPHPNYDDKCTVTCNVTMQYTSYIAKALSTMSNVKGITHTYKPTYNYHATLQLSSFSVSQLILFILWPMT